MVIETRCPAYGQDIRRRCRSRTLLRDSFKCIDQYSERLHDAAVATPLASAWRLLPPLACPCLGSQPRLGIANTAAEPHVLHMIISFAQTLDFGFHERRLVGCGTSCWVAEKVRFLNAASPGLLFLVRVRVGLVSPG